MDVAVLRGYVLDLRQLSALIRGGETHPALLPSIPSLLQRRIVELVAAAHDKRHYSLQFGRGLEFVLESLAQRHLHYDDSCCLRYWSTAQTNSPTSERRLRLAIASNCSMSWRGSTKVIF